MTDEGLARTAADGPGLDEVLARAAALGPPVCRWPACPRPARPLADRGTAAGRRPPARSAAGGGGRRPEFCSDEHRRRNGDAVRALRGLVDWAEELRARARGRERRRADAAVADLARRLALHGEPPAVAGAGGGTDATTDAAAEPQTGALAPVMSMTPCAPRSAGPDRSGKPATGAAGNVLAFAAHRTEAARSAAPSLVPVLGLRRTTGIDDFAESWSRLRDAAESARAVLAALRRARGPQRASLVAGVHLELAELAEAADQVLLEVSLLPASAGADRRIASAS